MLEKIKKVLFQKYPKTDCRGVFLSAYSAEGQIVVSAGAVYVDKSLEDSLNTIYRGIIKKEPIVSHIAVDVVLEYKEIMDMSELQSLSVKDYGIVIIENNKSGALLPDTKGVTDFAQGIKMVCEKNGLSGNVKIYVFKTERMLVF